MIGKERWIFRQISDDFCTFSRIGFLKVRRFNFSKVSLEVLRFSLETEVLVAIIPSILVSATNSTFHRVEFY